MVAMSGIDKFNENYVSSTSTSEVDECPHCGRVDNQWTIKADDRIPHKCPVCDGTGLVSRPPGIAGDINTWDSSGTGPYQCRVCNGYGVIWR